MPSIAWGRWGRPGLPGGLCFPLGSPAVCYFGVESIGRTPQRDLPWTRGPWWQIYVRESSAALGKRRCMWSSGPHSKWKILKCHRDLTLDPTLTLSQLIRICSESPHKLCVCQEMSNSSTQHQGDHWLGTSLGCAGGDWWEEPSGSSCLEHGWSHSSQEQGWHCLPEAFFGGLPLPPPIESWTVQLWHLFPLSHSSV